MSIEKKLQVKEKSKNEMVNVFKTSYHYYRNWVKQILSDGNIKGFRFIKDDVGWMGNISVPKTNQNETKNVLSDYKTKNPEVVEMWWR